MGCWGAGWWPRSSPRRPFCGRLPGLGPDQRARQPAGLGPQGGDQPAILRAYLRQQTKERDAVVRDEEDRIKLADDHAEVWQAIRSLPPLQAQVIALLLRGLQRRPGRGRAGKGAGHHQGAVAPRPPQTGSAARCRDRPWEAEVNIDERLRAASRALKDSSAPRSTRPAGCARSSGTPTSRWRMVAAPSPSTNPRNRQGAPPHPRLRPGRPPQPQQGPAPLAHPPAAGPTGGQEHLR